MIPATPPHVDLPLMNVQLELESSLCLGERSYIALIVFNPLYLSYWLLVSIMLELLSLNLVSKRSWGLFPTTYS